MKVLIISYGLLATSATLLDICMFPSDDNQLSDQNMMDFYIGKYTYTI
jgi:hypothetical protein